MAEADTAGAADTAPVSPDRRVVHPVEYGALIQQARDGDADAMERLLMRAQEVAYRFSFTVCGHPEDAEDVMQDALLRTYRYLGQIKNPEAFRPWLYRTVRNACLMKRRVRVGEPRHLVSLDQEPPGSDSGPTIDVQDQGRAPDELAMNAFLGRELRRALAAIPPAYRAIVFLREMEGLSTLEVAKVMGITEANAKQRLHRARLMLRQQLEVLQ